jgi:hypothetical protein
VRSLLDFERFSNHRKMPCTAGKKQNKIFDSEGEHIVHFPIMKMDKQV